MDSKNLCGGTRVVFFALLVLSFFPAIKIQLWRGAASVSLFRIAVGSVTEGIVWPVLILILLYGLGALSNLYINRINTKMPTSLFELLIQTLVASASALILLILLMDMVKHMRSVNRIEPNLLYYLHIVINCIVMFAIVPKTLNEMQDFQKKSQITRDSDRSNGVPIKKE